MISYIFDARLTMLNVVENLAEVTLVGTDLSDSKYVNRETNATDHCNALTLVNVCRVSLLPYF